MPADTRYEELPYASHSIAPSHPRRLATIAHLQGLTAAPWDGCRVLELGCGAGGNLLPMALDNPHGTFVGVDRSATAITQARQAAEELGLDNVTFQEAELETWSYRGPPIDYVLAHGVYSWVAPAARRRILEICRDHLGPRGIGYISYNTLPGWSVRGAVRDFLRWTRPRDGGAVEQVRSAREELRLLAAALPPGRSPQAAVVHQEVQRLSALGDDYLFHEFLTETNDAVYFHEFLAAARSCELQYLGEAEYSWMNCADLPAEVAETLRTRSRSTEDFEQYLDFVRWQLFRQTLLCRSQVRLDRVPPPSQIFPLWVAADLRVEGPTGALAGPEPLTFLRPKSRLTTPQPITKAALSILGESWPRWWSFEELLRTAWQRLGNDQLAGTPCAALPQAEELAETLRRAYGIALIELATEPPPVASTVGMHPRASRWAVRQAADSALLTNQSHATLPLNGFQRFLVGLLDGSRSREELLDCVVVAARDGVTLADVAGRPLTEPLRVREVLGETLDRTLDELCRLGMLAAPPASTSRR